MNEKIYHDIGDVKELKILSKKINYTISIGNE